MLESTPEITIQVNAQYLPNRAPEKDKYAFAYQVNITNNSQQQVQLINRYWLITDGNGKNIEVAGEGVVGEQPHIEPGQQFSYTSAAIIDTPVGAMQGHYEMLDANGALFKAPISPFSLAIPSMVN